MLYVLDTDVLSLLAHEDAPEAARIRRRIAQLPHEEAVVTTVINYEEQMRGWMAALGRARTPEMEIRVYERLMGHLRTFRRMTVLAYDARAESVFTSLRAQRIRIGAMDLKIAAIVLARDGTLITRNARDFNRVPGVRVENWVDEPD